MGYRLPGERHLKDVKTPANQVISLPSEAFSWTSYYRGLRFAHPRLQALDFQPSALLPSEAAAVYHNNPDSHKIFPHISTELRLSVSKILCLSVLKPPHLLNKSICFHMLDRCEEKTLAKSLIL